MDFPPFLEGVVSPIYIFDTHKFPILLTFSKGRHTTDAIRQRGVTFHFSKANKSVYNTVEIFGCCSKCYKLFNKIFAKSKFVDFSKPKIAPQCRIGSGVCGPLWSPPMRLSVVVLVLIRPLSCINGF